jgi:hypothetical protein
MLAAVALLAAVATHAQTSARIRGTITAIDGNTLSVKTRDGRDVKLAMPDNVSVSVATAVRFEDFKDGDFVGTTTKAGPTEPRSRPKCTTSRRPRSRDSSAGTSSPTPR